MSPSCCRSSLLLYVTFLPFLDLVSHGLSLMYAQMPISLIFCLVCILVPLLRRSHRPVHPGVAVGLDLVLWLAFILTGLVTVTLIYVSVQYGSDNRYVNDYDANGNYYSGTYHLASNGTWVFKVDDSYGGRSDDVRKCTPEFSSCAEQDVYINKLWQQRKRRDGSMIVVGVVQWMNVILHFALFVWACVDTHRRNKGKSVRKTQAVADRVLQDMQSRGLVMSAAGSGVGGVGGGAGLSRTEARQSPSQPGGLQQPTPNRQDQDVIEAIGRAR